MSADRQIQSLRDDARGVISLEVDPHPRARWTNGDPTPYLGSIKVKGGLVVAENLQPGAEVTISIADADGEVIAAGKAEIAYPTFKDHEDHGQIIAVERIHTAVIR